MHKKDVIYKFTGESPPFQPFANGYTDSYQECQLRWNPYCLKQDGLFYRFRTGDKEEEIELIPDACLNVLIEFDESNPRALFSGAFLRPVVLKLKPNTAYFGFKPYSNLGFKYRKIHPRDLVDSFTDFTYAFPCTERLVTELFDVPVFEEQARIFLRYAAKYLADSDYSPTFVDYLALTLCSSSKSANFNNMSQVFGYSERYCREKFKDWHGLSPKQYNDIIRFQNTLKSLFSGSYKGLCALAIEGGYFDQSHLTREFKRYTNSPPDKYLKRYTITV